MIPRIISGRPTLSFAAALVVVVCIFFIASKEHHTREDYANLATFTERSALPIIKELPFPINYDPGSYLDLHYRKVELEGSFLVDHEIYLENRVSQENPKPHSKKSSGYHIMMPFLLKSGSIIWVNRGWVGRDPVNRQNIPNVRPPENEGKISGYITFGRNNIFEMPKEQPRLVNGHVIALNFFLHDNKKDLPNRNVYPFLITQAGKGLDGLVRPEKNYFYIPDYSFDLRTWWFTLFAAVGFWLISGVVFLRNEAARKGSPSI